MSTRVVWAAVACAAATLLACGEDESAGPGSGGSGGAAGSGASGGSAGTGGSAGSGGTAGSAGSGGTAGSAGTDGGVPTAGRLLVAGTDFFSTTEIATIDLATSSVVGTVTVSDGDAVPVASAGLGFVLERSNSKLDVLSATGSIAKSIDVGKSALGDGGSGTTNPVGVVAVPDAGGDGGTADKAYVTLYDANELAIVDLTAGSVSKTVDLSSYLPSGDGDGSVEMQGATLAPNGRVYFVLGRIDRTTITAPSYELACPNVSAELMALDTATDSLVDLDSNASGDGLALGLKNPVDLALDASGQKLYVLSAGCFEAADGGSVRVGHGIESVDLTTGTVTKVLAPPSQDFLARLVLLSSTNALIDGFDSSYTEHWTSWTPGSATLGAELGGVPTAPSAEDAGHLLGVVTTTTDAGSAVEVVRYDVAKQSSTTVVASPWQGSFTSASGTALVR